MNRGEEKQQDTEEQTCLIRAGAGGRQRGKHDSHYKPQRGRRKPLEEMALAARGRAPALPPGAAPSEVTFELGQGVQLRLAALAAELRRALGALLPLRLAHRFPGEAVHFLRGRDGGAGSPHRRRRRRHRRGPGAWQLRLLRARNGQRQEEAGERRGELAPLRPVPPAAPPSRSRAPPSFSSPPAAASRPHLSAGGSWSPPRGHLPGLTEAGAGAEGGEEVVDFGRGGRVEESLKFGQLRRGRRGADAERPSLLFSPVRQPAGRPAPHCPLAAQPALLGASSRGAAIAGPLRAAAAVPALPCQRRTLISRGGDPPPRLWERTHLLLAARSGPCPHPYAPFRRPRRTPSERPLQLEKVEGARREGG